MRIVFGRLAEIHTQQILQYRTAHGHGTVEWLQEPTGERPVEEAFFVWVNVIGDGNHPRMPVAFDDSGEGAEGRTEKGHPVTENDQIRFQFAVAQPLHNPVERIDAVEGDIDVQVFRFRVVAELALAGKKEIRVLQPEGADGCFVLAGQFAGKALVEGTETTA